MENIRRILKQDTEYPQLLRKIKKAPEFIYCKGELPAADPCFAVVGARRCSDYGRQAAFEIVKELAEAGLTIVSGLAPGIDTFSHWATLQAKGKTIAVLGTGISEKVIYPKENLQLAERIAREGCLISEYSPETRGTYFTFPRRNRIIAGLALGVLVIEAKIKSGALITAEHAFNEGRKVFSLPGPIYSSTSKGCHYLIKRGAKLTESAEDILKELNLPFKRKSAFLEKGTEEEDLILQTIKEEALYIDKIIEKTKLPPQKVIACLSELEIKEKIKNLGNNIYAISNR